MAYNVIWTDSEGITDKSTVDTLSEAIDRAYQGKDYYGEDVKTQIFDSRNDVLIWDADDSPALQKYLEYDHEQWQSLSYGHHEKRDKPSVYFDIDGTLGKWYPDGRGLSLEEMIDPANHYFRNIEPEGSMITLAGLLHDKGYDVCVISAAYKDTIRDKWDWIKEHLPFIPDENICFAPIGADKTEFVKGNAEISILIDDYNKNLEQWNGVPIKALNGVNSHSKNYIAIDFHSVEEWNRYGLEQMEAKVKQGIFPESELDKTRDFNYRYLFSVIEKASLMISEKVDNIELMRPYEKEYQFLDRLKSDCEYYLDAGNRNPDVLWAKDEIGQIEKMLEIYNKLPVEPEWLSKKGIYNFIVEMKTPEFQAYKTYKTEWINEHIDDETMTETVDSYNRNYDTLYTFKEYVERMGFADGSCYVSFKEFLDNELKGNERYQDIVNDTYDSLYKECSPYDYDEDGIIILHYGGDPEWKKLSVEEEIALMTDEQKSHFLFSVECSMDYNCPVGKRDIELFQALIEQEQKSDKETDTKKKHTEVERD